MKRFYKAVILVIAISCAAILVKLPGEFCYVPAENYSASVEISVPKEAVVGQWIQLKATRRSGPWKRIWKKEAANETMAFPWKPPPVERNVQGNLFWHTDPPDAGRYDIPTPTSPPLERKVYFDKPGDYKIWGLSVYPEAKSNVETITIHPKP